MVTRHVLKQLARKKLGGSSRVSMPEAKPITSPGPYSNSGDFRRIFSEEIDSLYVLSLLLTAVPEKAEQCFVSGLEDSVNGKPVFKECAHSWARRAIIQNAVRVIKPRPMVEIAPSNSDSGKTTPAEQAEIAVVLELEPFDRFVYVMSVLEGYSEEDCSVLLGFALGDVITA
jgi:hypothetical protein